MEIREPISDDYNEFKRIPNPSLRCSLMCTADKELGFWVPEFLLFGVIFYLFVFISCLPIIFNFFGTIQIFISYLFALEIKSLAQIKMLLRFEYLLCENK